MSATQETAQSQYRLPSTKVLLHAAKLATMEDRPIMMDYWTESLDKKALIGVREDDEKLLVKNEEEYTSPISKIFRVESEFIVVTENSIYIVSAEIPTRKIA